MGKDATFPPLDAIFPPLDATGRTGQKHFQQRCKRHRRGKDATGRKKTPLDGKSCHLPSAAFFLPLGGSRYGDLSVLRCLHVSMVSHHDLPLKGHGRPPGVRTAVVFPEPTPNSNQSPWGFSGRGGRPKRSGLAAGESIALVTEASRATR